MEYKQNKDIEVILPNGNNLTKSAQLKRGNNIIKYLKPEEVQRFFDVIPLDKYRDRVMFELMYLAGLRITEVLTIERGFYDSQTHTLTVKWLKNRKYQMRTVPLRPEMEMLLIPYISTFKMDEKVFPISRQRAFQIFKMYARKAGLPEWAHPHTLRHSFAVNFYNQTKDIIALKHLLGHTRISTTTVYSDFSKADLRDKLMETKF